MLSMIYAFLWENCPGQWYDWGMLAEKGKKQQQQQ